MWGKTVLFRVECGEGIFSVVLAFSCCRFVFVCAGPPPWIFSGGKKFGEAAFLCGLELLRILQMLCVR